MPTARFLTAASILLAIAAAAFAQQTLPAPPAPPATAPARTGTISGTVIGLDDQPLPGATVGYLDSNTRLVVGGPRSPQEQRAAREAGIPATATVNKGLNTVTTNEKGEFTIKDVPVGTWQVVVSVIRPPGAPSDGSGIPGNARVQVARPNIEVKENQETKIATPLKLVMPRARGGGGA